MAKTASLRIDDKEYPLPVMEGTEGEKAVDTRQLRAASGYIAYDQGYGNTGSCESQITYLDGDNGILRHRGYPIEQLASYSESGIDAADPALVTYGTAFVQDAVDPDHLGAITDIHLHKLGAS